MTRVQRPLRRLEKEREQPTFTSIPSAFARITTPSTTSPLSGIGRVALSIAAIAVGLAAACGGGRPDTGGPGTAFPTRTPAENPAQVERGSPAPTPVDASSEPDDYNPTATMYEIIPGAIYATGTDSLNHTLAKIRARRDISQVPALVDSLDFFGGSARRSIVEALRDLTGQDHGTSPIQWAGWLGGSLPDYPPPEGYSDWKIGLLSLVDDRFADLLHGAGTTSRIDLREVVFGGVPPDGIPDLRNPESIPAQDAAYLHPSERVFGVSLNGERRAYPLRIVNAHEMVNDTLGGEPIAVMW